MSTHLPSTSNAHPWYTQRSAAPSLRPKYREAPRCGQFSCTRPTRPRASRTATRFSLSSRTRAGGLPGSGISALRQAGVQYRRSSSPIGVPGPTRVRISLSSALSTPRASLSRARARSGFPSDGGLSVRRVEGLGERRVLGGGQGAPVLAGGEDLLRAEDGPVVVLADRRGLFPFGEALGGGDEDVPHPGDGPVGGAELLLAAVVDRAHRLGDHQVLAHEVGDAAEVAVRPGLVGHLVVV